MKLFVIEDNEVEINAPWIKLIPEFSRLFAVKGKKLAFNRNTYAKKQLAYIYFMLDFSSPLKNWNVDDKKKEALRYTSLTEEDVKGEAFVEAYSYYERFQFECCRPLKTYNAGLKAMEAMDSYLETVNFDSRDKMGKLLYTPNQLVDNLSKVNKAYDELAKLEKRVETELAQNTGIRGKSFMSEREVKFGNNKTMRSEEEWDETGTNIPTGPEMVDLSELLNDEDVS